MKIFQEAFHNNLPNRGMAIENHHFVFLIGDLNYRIKDYTREEVIDLASKSEIDKML
jgi:hypothetical protein